MTKLYYKNLSLTLLIIIIWCVYVFFDYFTETDGFIKLTLFFNYFKAVVISSGLATLNILLRFTKFRNQTEKFKDNFFYIFSAIANLFLPMVYIIYLVVSKQSIIEFITTLEPGNIFIMLNVIFGCFILTDIYYNRKKSIENMNPDRSDITPLR
jgi:hypothetical protein